MSSRALDIVIVGGGIGGLAAANALLQRGITARVYEQAPTLAEVGAGVAVAPNGARLLRRMGFSSDIERVGVRWVTTRHHRFDGADIGPMFGPDLEGSIQQFGFHRADLLDMLARRLPPGVVNTGFEATGFEQNGEHAVVDFNNGRRVVADAVIAADGIHSRLQAFVVEPAAPLFSNTMAYRGLIPADAVGWRPGAVKNWLGPGKHFLVYPVRGGELLNYVAFVPTDEQMRESWSAPGDPEALANEYAGWDPLVERIIAEVKATFRWGLYDRQPLPRWTNGRITLLGDAAHPMLPHAGQGANQAIEDAVTVATVLAASTPQTAPRALLAYESLRRERTARVQLLSRQRGAMKESANRDVSTGQLARATEAFFGELRRALRAREVLPHVAREPAQASVGREQERVAGLVGKALGDRVGFVEEISCLTLLDSGEAADLEQRDARGELERQGLAGLRDGGQEGGDPMAMSRPIRRVIACDASTRPLVPACRLEALAGLVEVMGEERRVRGGRRPVEGEQGAGDGAVGSAPAIQKLCAVGDLLRKRMAEGVLTRRLGRAEKLGCREALE